MIRLKLTTPTDSLDRRSLHSAAVGGDSEIVRALIERGVEVNIRDNRGRTPLHWAAERGRIEVVRALIEHGALIDGRDDEGRTPLHWAARGEDGEIVQALIKRGAEANPRDNRGATPLHEAARYGDSNAVRALLSVQGIEIAPRQITGQTPIELAFEGGYHSIVLLLQQRGAQLPARLQIQGATINNSQSVHMISVHYSISASARRLAEHFARADVAGAQKALQQWAETLPSTNEPINPKRAAKACVTRLLALDFQDVGEGRSYVTLPEAMAYVWLALEECAEEKSPDRASASSEEHYQALLAEFVRTLYEIHRSYNLDAQGKEDDGERDNPTCASGSFNKVIGFLAGRHPCATLTFVTCQTMTAKAECLLQELVYQQFPLLPPESQVACYADWGGQKPAFFEKYLQAQFTLALKKEFAEFAVTEELRQHLSALCEEYPPLHHLSLPAPAQKTEAEILPVAPTVLVAYSKGTNNTSVPTPTETTTSFSPPSLT